MVLCNKFHGNVKSFMALKIVTFSERKYEKVFTGFRVPDANHMETMAGLF
mgnify:CR=1 FL=1